MVEVSIRSILLEQLMVTASLYYLPFIHHINAIRHLDSRKAMTDQYRTAILDQLTELPEKLCFRQWILSAGWFIQYN